MPMTTTLLAHQAAGTTEIPQTAVLVVCAAGVCAAYLAGTRRLLAASRSMPRWDWRSWGWRRYAFCAGVAVVVLALLPVLDPFVDESFPLHMVQHLVLVLVAAPLLAFGAPGLPLLLALPRRWRRRVATARAAAGVRQARSALAMPAVGVAVYALAIFTWHVPRIYTAALESDPVHISEHASFLLAAWLLWIPIAGPARSLEGGRAVLYVFLSGWPMTIVGALLALAPGPLYPAQTGTGPGALAQQQLAGVLMWIPAGIATVAVAAALTLTWFARMERSDPTDSPLPDPVPPALPGDVGRGTFVTINGEVPR